MQSIENEEAQMYHNPDIIDKQNIGPSALPPVTVNHDAMSL
jgi:hypothetical protein